MMHIQTDDNKEDTNEQRMDEEDTYEDTDNQKVG